METNPGPTRFDVTTPSRAHTVQEVNRSRCSSGLVSERSSCVDEENPVRRTTVPVTIGTTLFLWAFRRFQEKGTESKMTFRSCLLFRRKRLTYQVGERPPRHLSTDHVGPASGVC